MYKWQTKNKTNFISQKFCHKQTLGLLGSKYAVRNTEYHMK